MRIGGFQSISLVDFPRRCAAVVFTQGCPLRCSYCYNPHLVVPELFSTPLDQERVLAEIATRSSLIQGVVVTGGEPTIFRELPQFLQRIKSLGLQVKLDTNGSRPVLLEAVLRAKLVDFVAMDLKAPFDRYDEITPNAPSAKVLRRSFEAIIGSGVEYQFRTVAVPQLVGPNELSELQQLLPKGSRLRVNPFKVPGPLVGGVKRASALASPST